MISKTILIAGQAAVGKSCVAKHLLTYLIEHESKPCACKIDCIHTTDADIYEQLNIPFVVGLSNDICPDHFLVSNMVELLEWGKNMERDLLLIETAGLCNRCCPATSHTINICTVDCTASCKSPEKLGPMLTKADLIALTKIDMVSQAEREIIYYHIQNINPNAKIFPIDGISGYGIELLGQHILSIAAVETYENDVLRHTMPSGVCSYCIGEKRIGSAFQQGIIGKLNFGGATRCKL